MKEPPTRYVYVIIQCVEVTLESQLIEAVRKRKYLEGTFHKVVVCYTVHFCISSCA